MSRAPRSRAVELSIGFAVAFGVMIVPGVIERLVVGDDRPRGHGGFDLRPMFFAGLALLGYGLAFLTLPFTRHLRLAGSLDAALWGVTYAFGGVSAIVTWGALVQMQQGGHNNFLSEELFATLLLTATIQALLAPLLHAFSVRLRPQLACTKRPPLRRAARFGLPLLATASSVLGVGLLLGLVLITEERGGRNVNPYLMATPPFAIVLVVTSVLLRRRLDTARRAALYGVYYGVAVGALHAWWIVGERGHPDEKEVLVMAVVLLTCVVVSALLTTACRRLAT